MLGSQSGVCKMTLVAILTIITIVVFSIGGWFQVARMWRVNSAHSVSLWYASLLTIGVATSWGMVMLTDANMLVRIERSLNLLSALTIEIVVIYYKRKDYKRGIQ